MFVIDCGKAKETSYDALNKLACLLPSWISKASAHQVRALFQIVTFFYIVGEVGSSVLLIAFDGV